MDITRKMTAMVGTPAESKYALAEWPDPAPGEGNVVTVKFHAREGQEETPSLYAGGQNGNRLLKISYLRGEKSPHVLAFAPGEGPVKIVLTEE
jgi:hypothetical protein